MSGKGKPDRLLEYALAAGRNKRLKGTYWYALTQEVYRLRKLLRARPTPQPVRRMKKRRKA